MKVCTSLTSQAVISGQKEVFKKYINLRAPKRPAALPIYAVAECFDPFPPPPLSTLSDCPGVCHVLELVFNSCYLSK